MLQAEVVVIDVMGRCHFKRACTEFLIYVFVKNYRDPSVKQRHKAELACKVRITLIVRMYAYRSIAQYGFGAHGGYGYVFFLVTIKAITHIIQL